VNNLNDELRGYLEDDGTLAKYAWPGGYPLYYLGAESNVLCARCASANDDYSSPIAAAGINWEDSELYCDHCSGRIESAYGEGEV